MKYLLIFGDGGHGIDTPGKRTFIFNRGKYKGQFMHESEFNKAVVKQLKKYFDNLKNKEINYRIIFIETSPNAENTSLKVRTKLANNMYQEYCTKYGKQNVKALFVSVHANAYGKTWNNAHGIETFVYLNMEGSNTYKIAQTIHNQIIKITGKYDRGLQTANFHVLRETNMPSLLTECGGFMTNEEEANMMMTEQYRKKCAKAIYDGICEYYNIKIIENKSNNTSKGNKKQHWANSSYKYLLNEGLNINEKRFDDNITRGEAFRLMELVIKNNKK